MRRFSRNASKITIALIVAIVAAAALLLTATPAPAKPSVSWNPTKVNETVLAGESITVPVSFTASRTLKDIVVQVVPELEPFVQVAQTSFSHIDRGQTANLDVIISPSVDALPQTVEGTIHLRSGGKSKKTFARPLPVMVTIEWPEIGFTRNDVTVNFSYPAGWELAQHDFGMFAYSPRLSAPDDELAPPDLTIQILDNPFSLPLEEFLEAHKDSWYLLYDDINELTIDGHPAILAVAAEPPRDPALAAFIATSDAVVSVLGHERSREEFNEVLTLLRIP